MVAIGLRDGVVDSLCNDHAFRHWGNQVAKLGPVPTLNAAYIF